MLFLCRIVLILNVLSCYVLCFYLELPEGSPCTWKGLNGVCAPIYQCLSAKQNIKMKEKPPICMFQSKEPIICCTDCFLVHDTRNTIFNEHLGFLYQTGQKAHDMCIKYIDNLPYQCKEGSKSVLEWHTYQEKFCNYSYTRSEPLAVIHSGDRPAVRNEFPHMALLAYGSDVLSTQWLCSGSLISNKFILTSAQCTTTPSLGQVTYAALGMLRRTDPQNKWKRYRIKNVFPYPYYESPSKYHDIALLETGTPIIFQGIRPACLPLNDELDEFAVTTSWGVSDKEDLADPLKAVYLKKFTDEECSSLYPPHMINLSNGYVNISQICYGDYQENIANCQRYNGGPLLVRSDNHTSSCVFTILGVTSYGNTCAVPGNAGMYTRVWPYVPWIESIVWP